MESTEEYYKRVNEDVDSKLQKEKEAEEERKFILDFLNEHNIIIKTTYVGRWAGLEAYKIKKYINILFFKIPVKDYYSKFSYGLHMLFPKVIEEMKRRGELS